MLRWSLVCALGGLLLGSPTLAGERSCLLDRYGGWLETKEASSGWFRTSRADGRWWLIDPEGYRFLSVGVNRVEFRPDPPPGASRSPYATSAAKKYRRQSRWASAVTARLREWGLNTVGASSDPATWQQEMPFVVMLDLAGAAAVKTKQGFPDVFDPAYPRAVSRAVRRSCRGVTNDPWLLGYFTDDELPWGDAEGAAESLFVEFLGLPDGTAGRQVLVSFLRGRYQSVESLNEAWHTSYHDFEEVGRTPQVGSHIPEPDREDFSSLAARQYFRIAHDAVRAADAHHLILGCRFRGAPPRFVLEAMPGYVDLVSLNHTGERPPAAAIREMSEVTACPVLVSDFHLGVGEDAGLDGNEGGPDREPGRARAEQFERYVQELMALPMVVGYHWHRHADRSPAASPDGDVGRHGLVDANDDPHAQFVAAVAQVNKCVYLRAAEAGVQPAGE